MWVRIRNVNVLFALAVAMLLPPRLWQKAHQAENANCELLIYLLVIIIDYCVDGKDWKKLEGTWKIHVGI